MPLRTLLLAALIAVGCLGSLARAQDSGSAEVAEQQEGPSFDWQRGPGTGSIGKEAIIAIPEDYVFLDPKETARYVEHSQNIPSDTEQLFAPTSGDWDAYFSFSPEGYVQDKEPLDAASLLATMQGNQESSNAERKRRGWTELDLIGWHIAPRYDPDTQVLEWASLLRERGSDQETVNYNTRVLGRHGVMTVQLVSAPERFDASLADFRRRLDGFAYREGETYAEFREGDRVAEYGLAALVAGGAVAIASKKGFFGIVAAFFAAAWKLLIPLLIGVGVWVKSLLTKKKDPQ